MASLLPANFPIPPPQAIASYDFFDIAEGTGIKAFYPTIEFTAGTASYMMIQNNAPASAPGYGTFTVGVEKDFDLTAFNTHKRLQGCACISYSGDAQTGSGQMMFTLERVRGGVPTAITAQINGGTITSSGQVFLTSLPLIGIVEFRKGDILRLNITSNVTGADNIALGLDPANLPVSVPVAFINDRSICILYIPFLLDL